MSDPTFVCKLHDLTENQGKAFKIKEHPVAIFKLSNGEIYAIENSCPHAGAPLDNGTVEGYEVSCLWHSWAFDLKDGSSSNCPGSKVKTYEVKIEADSVLIEI